MPTTSLSLSKAKPRSKSTATKAATAPATVTRPKKAVKEAPQQQQQSVACVGKGAGITAGLEIWRTTTGAFVLQDMTPDAVFATDVATWNIQPPKRSATKKRKDATVTQ
jgi:hypothetical protein